jgi:plastocyanin
MAPLAARLRLGQSRRRRRAGTRALAALAVGVLLAACDEDRRFPTAADLEGRDFTPDHVVTVDASGFDPDRLEITSGEIVLLVNAGEQAHSFSAEERFDTGLLQPGEEVTLVMEQPGEIPFHDRTTGAEGLLVVSP